MDIEDCTCKGINPHCEKCFGRGYYEPALVQDKNKFKSFAVDKPTEKVRSFDDEISNLEAEEIIVLANKIISLVDLKSSNQYDAFVTLFKTKYKRFPTPQEFSRRQNLYDTIKVLENEKKFLKEKLATLVKKALVLNTTIKIKYIHKLSEREIDVSAKVELKGIRKLLRIR